MVLGALGVSPLNALGETDRNRKLTVGEPKLSGHSVNKEVMELNREEMKKIADDIRRENDVALRVWTQYELRRKCRVGWIRQIRDHSEVIDLVEYLGVFRIKNNTVGYPYPAHLWIGYFKTWDSDPRRPLAGLLEVPVSVANLSDSPFDDFGSYVGEYKVGPDGKGSVFFQACKPET